MAEEEENQTLSKAHRKRCYTYCSSCARFLWGGEATTPAQECTTSYGIHRRCRGIVEIMELRRNHSAWRDCFSWRWARNTRAQVRSSHLILSYHQRAGCHPLFQHAQCNVGIYGGISARGRAHSRTAYYDSIKATQLCGRLWDEWSGFCCKAWHHLLLWSSDVKSKHCITTSQLYPQYPILHSR